MTNFRLPLLLLLTASACGTSDRTGAALDVATPVGGVLVVRDTTIPAMLEAAGMAAPIRQAVLSTKLMGAVTEVPVEEGARVRAGQVLVRLDARDLDAQRSQAQAELGAAEAVRQDAETQAARFRSLYADSAATRAQLDAAETGLARAEAAVQTARAAGAGVAALGDYAVLRAPFAGVVTRRYVDPGAFAAPGAPLIALQDASRLRVSVGVSPQESRGLRPGQRLEARIEETPARAVIEGVVPAADGALYTVNALVDNAAATFLAGSAAVLLIPQGVRTGIVVPAAALVREGDLTGVRVRTAAGDDLRWVRVGRTVDGGVEILSGLRSGEAIVLPTALGDRP